MPWFTDAGVLYYRKDLLEKYGKKPPPDLGGAVRRSPRTIQDKERAAGNDKMWGFVYQAKAYEGLTCDALEWVDSYGGGTIVDSEGQDHDRQSRRPPQRSTWAATTIGTIAPEGVLNYTEEEARGVFQSGNAVFMRNWPYAWNLSQAPDSPVKGKVGVVGPADGRRRRHITAPRWAAGSWRSPSTASTRKRRPISSNI